MKDLKAEPLFHAQNILGEGPLWHPLENRLFWVDILNGDFYQSDESLESFTKTRFNCQIGAFGFRNEGGFIFATGQGFALWDQGKPKLDFFWNPLPVDRKNVRLNDGKVDPAGRFWAGSLDTELVQGELYRLDPDGSQHTLLHNLGISNGLGWSPDRHRMYTTDSFKYTIYAFDYDLVSGNITNQRVFVKLPQDKTERVPDGLCVDAEGCVWSAHWNGWRVVRYDPDGNPIMSVDVPAQRVTSCCFGGENLSTLFITTAREGLSEVELENQPYAGDVFIIKTNTQGQPTNFFGTTENYCED
jgi:sugar lactone lactonase YvrE